MVTKQAGKWYRGIVKATDCFLARWHRDEVEKIWSQRAKENNDKKGEKEKGWGQRERGGGGQPC